MKTLEERVWGKVDKSAGADGCWVWTGEKTRKNYGVMRLGKKNKKVSRLVYELCVGPIAEGLWVLHKCDNRRCVNPMHLYLGDVRQNAKDATDRNRWATGDRNAARLYPDILARGEKNGAYTKPERRCRGERHGSAKLREGDVVMIRRRYAAGGCTLRSLAADYGVHNRTIQRAITGKKWAHIAMTDEANSQLAGKEGEQP